MNIATTFQSEIVKARRTASVYLTVLMALCLPIVNTIALVADGPYDRDKANPLQALYIENLKGINIMILPFFLMLICTLLPQLEYRSNSWKQVMTVPASAKEIYTAKFLHVQLLLALFIFIFCAGNIISAFIINLFSPSLHVLRISLDWPLLLNYLWRTYVLILPVSVIQFVLGLKLRNFVAPLAIGITSWFIGNILLFEMHSTLANYIPYVFTVLNVLPKYEHLIPQLLLTSLGISIVVLTGGLFLFQRRSGK